MSREQIAGSAEPREKCHDGGRVKPGDVRSAFETAAHGAMAAAPVMTEMKRQVPFDRQMDVDRAREEGKHAQREAHEKTEEVKIRQGHNPPRPRSPYFPVISTNFLRRPRVAFAYPASRFIDRSQNFCETIKQPRSPQNLTQQQERC